MPLPLNIAAYPPEFVMVFENAINGENTEVELPTEKDAKYTQLRLGGFRKALAKTNHPLKDEAYKVTISRKGCTITIGNVDESEMAQMFRKGIKVNDNG